MVMLRSEWEARNEVDEIGAAGARTNLSKSPRLLHPKYESSKNSNRVHIAIDDDPSSSPGLAGVEFVLELNIACNWRGHEQFLPERLGSATQSYRHPKTHDLVATSALRQMASFAASKCDASKKEKKFQSQMV